MNYYSRNIGDWRTATYNLTKVQRCIYSDLIDTYYDKERPLPSAGIAEEMGCRTEEELSALAYVLKRFFKLESLEGVDVYRHERCDEEIAHFHKLVNDAQKAGRASASARAQRKMNGGATSVERPSDAKATPGQRTPNDTATTQYPIPNTQTGSKEPVGSAVAPAPSPTPQPAKQNRPSRRCPKDFVVSAALAQWAGEKVSELDVKTMERETEKFRNHTFGRAITDWDATWRNWMLRAAEGRPKAGIPASVARDQERQRLAAELYGNSMEQSNGTGSKGVIDIESRVVRDGEEFTPDPDT